MAELIQGFCPRRRIKQFKSITYLEDYEVPIQALMSAIRNGELATRAKPSAFVSWAIGLGIPLPEPFVARVLEDVFVLRRPTRPKIYSDELIREDTHRATSSKPKAAKVRGYDSAICALARNFALDYLSRNGTLPPKKMINRHIASRLHPSISETCIDRAYAIEMLLDTTDERRARRLYRANKRQLACDAN